MSSFHNQGTELWPKNHFRLFWTIFELFVLDWFLLMLHHSQSPPQVGICPYYKFRTQLLNYSDSKCKKYQIFFWDICWKIHHSHFLWQFLNFLSKTHFYWSYITTNYLHRLEVIHITTLESKYWNILTQFAENIKFSSEIFVEKKHCSHLFFPDFIWLLGALGPKDQFETPKSMGF